MLTTPGIAHETSIPGVAHLGADGLAEPDHEMLGPAIRRAACAAALAGGRGDVDEVPATARGEACVMLGTLRGRGPRDD